MLKVSFFFFNDTATTEIYPLSLHDALPISLPARVRRARRPPDHRRDIPSLLRRRPRSEEHTSELQSPCNLVCRLLLEKKKKLKDDKNLCLSVGYTQRSHTLLYDLPCILDAS